MFKVGDCAFYCAHGLVLVQNIEQKEVRQGEKRDFYILHILDTKATVMLPVHQSGGRLRKLISLSEIEQIYKILQDRPVVLDKTTWNKRSRDYTEKILSGSPYAIAEVVRNLALLKLRKKELSFGERKLLKRAQDLLIKEISLAKQIEEKLIVKEIQAMFISLESI